MATKTATKATKKVPAKKGAIKSTPAKKAAAAPAAPIKDALNKTQLIAYLVERSGVESKSVKAVLAQLEVAILASMHKKGAGKFVFPGLLKVKVDRVKAKPAHVGINPFTKEQKKFPAKPASVKVKIRALKKLKDAAN